MPFFPSCQIEFNGQTSQTGEYSGARQSTFLFQLIRFKYFLTRTLAGCFALLDLCLCLYSFSVEDTTRNTVTELDDGMAEMRITGSSWQ